MSPSSHKSAFYCSRWRALGGCSVHALPIAISVVLLTLNLSNTYYADIGAANRNLQFNALQFAAKLHEVFIAASLSVIAASYIQYELSFGGGLSLGGVSSGLQLSNLNSLWNPGLWSQSFSPDCKSRRARFTLLVVLLISLAAIAGPSSAILMLPSTGWWEYSAKLQENLDPTPAGYRRPRQLRRFWLSANESVLWPSSINLDNFLPIDCNFTAASIPEHCPAGGLPLLLSQVNPEVADVRFDVRWNLTVPSNTKVGKYSRFLAGKGMNTNCHAVDAPPSFGNPECFWTTTTSSSVNNMLQWISIDSFANQFTQGGGSDNIRSHLSLLNGSRVLSPQVMSICLSNRTILPPLTFLNGSYWENTRNSEMPLTFPTLNGLTWTADATTFSESYQSTNFAARWIEPLYMANNTPSIAVASITLQPESEVTNNSSQYLSVKIDTCSLYASWQPIETYTIFPVDSYIHSSATGNFALTIAPSLEPRSGMHVHLDIDWANLALPPRKTIDKLAAAVSFPGRNIVTGMPAALASLLVTDAMSRAGMDLAGIFSADGPIDYQEIFRVPFNTTTLPTLIHESDLNAEHTTPLKLTTFRNGYSYSISGITRRFAIGVLILQIWIALIHTVLVVGYKWSAGLKSMSDLLMLVIESARGKAPESAENSNPRKHNCTIKLREASGSKLEIMIDDQVDFNTKTSTGMNSRALSYDSLQLRSIID